MFNLHAGAGFKILINPFSLAAFKQCKVTSNGTSNCVKNIFDFLILLVSISSLVKLEGAPLTTVIAFFPVLASTCIPATPVLCFFEIIILDVFILSFLRLFIASLPYSSLPIFEIKLTFPPNLEIAIA